MTLLSSLSSRSPLAGIVLVALSFPLFTTMDTLVKWLSGSYSVAQIILLNTIFGHMTVMLFLSVRRGGWASIRTRRLPLHLLRGSIGIAGGFSAFWAFSHLPLADVYATLFTAPLMITLLSIPIAGESVGWRRGLAVVVGFIGVLIMLRPGQGVFHLAALGGLGGALTHALSMLIVRRMAGHEGGLSFAFYSNTASLFWSGLIVATVTGFEPPPLSDLLLHAASGGCGSLGLMAITLGFARAPAAVLAPFQYTQMIWGVLFGYGVWGDVPDLWLVAGAAVVIGSGLYVVRREARLQRTGPSSSDGSSPGSSASSSGSSG